jgi:hypothetical protein
MRQLIIAALDGALLMRDVPVRWEPLQPMPVPAPPRMRRWGTPRVVNLPNKPAKHANQSYD